MSALDHCYDELLFRYVACVRRMAGYLWTSYDKSLRELLYHEPVSSCYGECYAWYEALLVLYRNSGKISRPVDFNPLLQFSYDLEISGPHFDTYFLINFYPKVETIEDSVLDAIHASSKKYLQEV